MEDINAVLLSFVLVTVIGGAFGAWLQRRTWAHQHEVEQRSRERAAALDVFEAVSTMMDRRLFRLDQLRIWVERDDEERFLHALAEYRSVLTDWNDNINRLLAKQQIYLGQEIREAFDYEVGKRFVEAGAALEVIVRGRLGGGGKADTSDIRTLVERLRSDVYEFNLRMLSKIERG